MYHPKKNSKKISSLDKEEFNDFISSLQADLAIHNLNTAPIPTLSENEDIAAYIKHIKKLLMSELHIFPRLGQYFDQNKFNLGIFRTRPVEDYRNINNLSEHLYPPSHLTRMGRCNFPKHPVFYSAQDPLTAVCEVVKNSESVETEFCISKWKLKDLNQKIHIESIVHFEENQSEFFKIMKSNQSNKLADIFKGRLNKDQIDAQRKIFKYLHKQFISKNNYSISATIAHEALYCADSRYKADILLYPSIQTDHNGLNMAMNTDFVDNNVVLDRVYIIKLKSPITSFGSIRFSVSQFGIYTDNHINWYNVNPENEFYKQIFIEDFRGNLKSDFQFDFRQNS